ncbi:MAG: hypothetical protein CMI90_03250 [Pelagibacteraceae bacterium]|nr:hypothetical protein [Pelagibacteraceae bacterium]|tara:strand:- start:949 stop:2286 length:1338 start_codon:yes stop_codon:yes gene_type:complete
MIGFETIGNATVTVFDDKPILTTDPWINGNPYFGSWSHAYSIPKDQLNNILSSNYIWLSHGHPDHIDPESLDLFKNKTFLVADHYGDRIYNDLRSKFKCIKLKSNEWFNLSKNVRIKSFADWNQDSCLLIEIGKKDILFNLNDGSGLGWSKEIKKIISLYKNKFLLKLINWGDADMINFYNHHNEFILPLAANKKPCGESYNYYMKKWGCNYSIPFSAFHKYSRNDSINMNKFCTPLDEHYEKFNNKFGEMLPAFIKWNSNNETYQKINPNKNESNMLDSSQFGDNWSDDLDKSDKDEIKKYFYQFDQIKKKFGFLSFKVGNSELNLKFSNKKQGILFETPRNSFIYSIKNNIFDDLLIGNFMKVRLINVPSLYPDFTPYVTKYGDNGLSRSKKELKKYFEYYKFNSANFWLDFLKIKSEQIIRNKIEKYKSVYYFARKIKRTFT